MKILATLKPKEYQTFHHLYGTLIEIDWETKRILRSLKIPAAYFQDDTAFMASFLGGICSIGRRLFVTAWNFIVEVEYDSFEIINAVSWPPMADLHGMDTDGESIWVASSAIDALLCLDARSLELKWRWGPDEPILYHERIHSSKTLATIRNLPLVNRLVPSATSRTNDVRFVEREYRYVHKSVSPYHYHHLNDVRHHKGCLYVTTKGWNNDGTKSAVIKLDPRSRQSEFFVPPGGFRGVHDGIFLDGRFYVTESAANSVAWREPDSTVVTRYIEPSPYFVRGLCYTGSSFIVGFSTMRGTCLPAQIVEYDLEFKSQLGARDISSFYPKQQGTTVHALALSPE